MMRIQALFFFVSVNAFATGTHCTSAEKVAFTCSLASSKVVSVCLLQGQGDAPTSLSYRFGRLGSPEFVFPSSPVNSHQKFRFAHYFRYQVDRSELNFSNADAEYSVFDYFDGEETPSYARGVNVTVNGKDHESRCKGEATSHLIELEKVVPCDTENALASCT